MHKIARTFRDLFAERQVFIRKNGNVTYVALSARSLFMLCMLFLLLASWIGFASVHTIFNNGLGAEREREVREMELAYEAELNRLRLEYDDLNAQLVLTRDWFSETTDKLEKRHNDLTLVFEQHATISDELRDMQSTYARVAKRNRRDKSKTKLVARSGGTQETILESRPQANTGDNQKIIQLSEPEALKAQNDLLALPHLSDGVYERIASLDVRQQDLIDALEESVDQRIGEYEGVIEGTDILEPESFMARLLPESDLAIGGPYIPLEDENPGINSSLHQQLYRISNNLERLQNLSMSVSKIPLSLPIHGAPITSHFGPRLDPFKKRVAFHAGIDFGASTGTPVYATLSGTVVRADYKGPYGLVVEIDHGNGFRTRYGHLARSRVRRGQSVEFQQHIADAGNSGRSTGPHLHYEVWYEGKVRDPIAFLDSGKQIYNIAKTLSRPQLSSQ